ncbi:MAG TPA: universal stress protein [Dehalococcoidia bacterium]|jgi:nucleotide-binding universal stress UspA family protein|nr:universal stress protein [Dehalococcoidia bacterium]
MSKNLKALIPLDGSPLAEHALAYVSALRPLGVTEARLISAIELLPVAIRREYEDEEREYNLLSAYQQKVADDLRLHTGLEVSIEVVRGQAAEVILQDVRDYRPDYLIVSTHGSSGLSRLRFGSVADKVIRGADCSTLVVGPLAAEQDSWLESRLMPVFKSVLVPLDGSKLAEQALPEAESFADAFGAKLHVVTAVAAPFLGLGEAWASSTRDVSDDPVAYAKQYLDELRQNRPALASSSVDVRMGPADQVLREYIAENGIDLVIMTSHGRGGVVRTALGSTTDRLLGGPAPILVVRRAVD